VIESRLKKFRTVDRWSTVLKFAPQIQYVCWHCARYKCLYYYYYYYKTKLESVSLSCKSQRSKTANINFFIRKFNAQTLAITYASHRPVVNVKASFCA